MRLFFKNLNSINQKTELKTKEGEIISYDPIRYKWTITKDFLDIAYPLGSLFTESIHIFLSPDKLNMKQNKAVLKNNNNFVVLVSPRISKRLLELFKLNMLEGKRIIIYLDQYNLNDYLFLIAIKLKGIYLTYIKDNFLYIQNKGNQFKFDVNRLNILDINKLVPHDKEIYKGFEIILT